MQIKTVGLKKEDMDIFLFNYQKCFLHDIVNLRHAVIKLYFIGLTIISKCSTV